jgi:glycosyltransferase involved in cell wall biosynthesis
MPTTWLASQLRLPHSATIHHGLPIISPRARLPREHTTPLLVFVGRLVTTKGVRLLIEASRILEREGRSFELLVIGDGPERASLEALVCKWHLTSYIHFLGQIPQQEMAKILAQADFVVVPSLGGEVFGMVVAENMLRGIPVLASDLGAFVEVLGEAGVTFKTGNFTDLAGKMAWLLDNASSLKQIGEAANRRVLDCFTLDRMIKGHAEIYQQLILSGISRA